MRTLTFIIAFVTFFCFSVCVSEGTLDHRKIVSIGKSFGKVLSLQCDKIIILKEMFILFIFQWWTEEEMTERELAIRRSYVTP